jgi:hypothetical protein
MGSTTTGGGGSGRGGIGTDTHDTIKRLNRKRVIEFPLIKDFLGLISHLIIFERACGDFFESGNIFGILQLQIMAKNCGIRSAHFFFVGFLFDLPALLMAIATACFCGLPAAISVLIFLEIVFLEEPFFSGMTYFPEMSE